MEFVPTLVVGALMLKIVSVLKYLSVAKFREAGTQVLAWGAGFITLLLVAQSEWADGYNVGDQPLSKLSTVSILLAGFALASTASFAYDIKRALDGSDTAAEPGLFAPTALEDVSVDVANATAKSRPIGGDSGTIDAGP